MNRVLSQLCDLILIRVNPIIACNTVAQVYNIYSRHLIKLLPLFTSIVHLFTSTLSLALLKKKSSCHRERSLHFPIKSFRSQTAKFNPRNTVASYKATTTRLGLPDSYRFWPKPR